MDNFIEFLYSKFLQSDGVSIDTRTLKSDNLFFGLKGENSNGSLFAQKAIDLGASFAVIDDPQYKVPDRTILVDDALKALQRLAIFHRSRFKRAVLALTGSNGKTTTKELLTQVLRKKYIVHSTEGNYNNHIGVPLTLLHIHPQVEIAIIEMGANHVGEIAQLCEMARPTHGLITNIGHAHTETFGGIEGVLRGKSELFDFLRKSEGKVFINQLDERISNMSKRFQHPVLYPDDDLNKMGSDPFLRYGMNGETKKTHLLGDHNYENVAAAVSVGRFFKVEETLIAQAIRDYKPKNLRAQWIQKNDVTVILDAYNANPESMKASLGSLAGMKGEKLAILGDMNELEDPELEHQRIGELLNELDIKSLLVGAGMKSAHVDGNNSKWFPSKEELKAFLKSQDFKNKTILIKASRSLKLETLLDDVIQ